MKLLRIPLRKRSWSFCCCRLTLKLYLRAYLTPSKLSQVSWENTKEGKFRQCLLITDSFVEDSAWPKVNLQISLCEIISVFLLVMPYLFSFVQEGKLIPFLKITLAILETLGFDIDHNPWSDVFPMCRVGFLFLSKESHSWLFCPLSYSWWYIVLPVILTETFPGLPKWPCKYLGMIYSGVPQILTVRLDVFQSGKSVLLDYPLAFFLHNSTFWWN